MALFLKRLRFGMRSLLKFFGVLISARLVLASAIEVEKRDNVTLKAPIVAVPSEHWQVFPIVSRICAN